MFSFNLINDLAAEEANARGVQATTSAAPTSAPRRVRASRSRSQLHAAGTVTTNTDRHTQFLANRTAA